MQADLARVVGPEVRLKVVHVEESDAVVVAEASNLMEEREDDVIVEVDARDDSSVNLPKHC